MKYLFIIFIVLAIISCGNRIEDHKELYWSEIDTLTKEYEVTDTGLTYKGTEDQMTLNDKSSGWRREYYDTVEKEFSDVLRLLPEYQELLLAESNTWEKYYEATRRQAYADGDNGSSEAMFVNSVLNGAITLRKLSLGGLLLHLKHRKADFCITPFTENMISEAYTVWRDSWRFDKSDSKSKIEALAAFISAMNNEEQCWYNWMNVRAAISNELTRELKRVYDGSTNEVIREKLIQLKNQNEGKGMGSLEVFDYMLSPNCTDKELIEYPGFNIRWDQH